MPNKPADSDKLMDSTRTCASTVAGTTYTVLIPTPAEPSRVVECPDCKRRIVVKSTAGPVPVQVTINCGDNGPFEVFVGDVPNGQRALVNGLCRLISASLQSGVDLKRVVKMLVHQAEDAKPVWWKPLRSGQKGLVVHSIPDALAKLLAGLYLSPEERADLHLSFEAAQD